MVAVPVAEPRANHSHYKLSLFAWAPTETQPGATGGAAGPRRTVQRQSFQPNPSNPYTVCLCSLTQARIPS